MARADAARRPAGTIALLAAAALASSCGLLGPVRRPLREPGGPAHLFRPVAVLLRQAPPGGPARAAALLRAGRLERALKQRVAQHIARSGEAIVSGDLYEASARYREAARLDPRDAALRQAAARFEASRELVERHEERRARAAARDDRPAAWLADGDILGLLPLYGPALARRKADASRLKAHLDGLVARGESAAETGDTTEAALAFFKVLLLDPTNRAALAWFRGQVTPAAPNTPPGVLLHQVKPGETLSQLAERYLGDASRFGVIASLNAIDDPSRVEAGQRLAIPLLGPPGDGIPRSPATAADPHPRPSRPPRAPATNDAQADESYRSGLEAMARGEFDRAVASFTRSRELNPDHPGAADLLESARRGLAARVDALYRQGIALYRDQRLEEALRRWEEALRLDPAHDGSRKYAEKARQLLEKLRQMEK